MTEFVIVFPVLFLFILLIIQTALLLSAKHVVHYAAFCAARSAIVHSTVPGADYFSRAKLAAVIACAPISPSISNIPLVGDVLGDITTSLGNMAQGLVGLRGRSYIKILAKLPASYILTSVDILDENSTSFSNSSAPVNPRQDLQVQVTHYYSLRIPIINKIFFTSYWLSRYMPQGRIGDDDEPISILGFSLPTNISVRARNEIYDSLRDLLIDEISLPAYMVPINATCTMTAEGDYNG
jgi:hypothetical protein